MAPTKKPQPCQWLSEREAFKAFATHTGGTESAGHIKPLHWYVACRLVVEGGFHPDSITPRPPFDVKVTRSKGRARYQLVYDPTKGGTGEQTILGGLKTKNVDVVVSLDSIGPVLAVSCKGVTKAFRNLTNRMEETIGECTNLHITYPAMVIGYFALMRANRTDADIATAPDLDAVDDATAGLAPTADEATELADAVVAVTTETAAAKPNKANDLAILPDESIAEGIVRFHAALREMTGRRGIRDEISRYEAMTVALVEPKGDDAGASLDVFPSVDSPLHLSKFFETLYLRYEERFVIGAPLLADRGMTTRLFWAPDSPALGDPGAPGDPLQSYGARLASE